MTSFVSWVAEQLVSKLTLQAEDEEEEEESEEAPPEEEAEEEEEEEEEDLIDPAEAIKENCGTSHCTKYKARLEECNARVEGKSKTTETCFEEILDFYHCVDHCAADEIFKHLK